MRLNFSDKRDGCVCDKKQTNQFVIADGTYYWAELRPNFEGFLERSLSRKNAQHPIVTQSCQDLVPGVAVTSLILQESLFRSVTDTGHCHSSLLVSKHSHFSHEKPTGEQITNRDFASSKCTQPPFG